MPVNRNEYNAAANGGTEQLIAELERHVDPDLLSSVEVIPGRMRGRKWPNLPCVFWVHDTHNDPEMYHLSNGGWKNYDKLVFVSYWQMNSFIQHFDIPHSKCVVVKNAVDVVIPEIKDLDVSETIRLIYHTTPHRGLDILANVYKHLVDFGYDVSLDVYSSFKIYGQPQRDEHYKHLFDFLSKQKNCTLHGSVPNLEVREALSNSHLFVYPCTWPETSCRSLMEAMMDGALAIHSNLAVLPETAADWTMMYEFNEDKGKHYQAALDRVLRAIDVIREKPEDFNMTRHDIARDTRQLYSWETRKLRWERVLRELL